MVRKLQFLEQIMAGVGIVLTLACLVLVLRTINQDDKIKEITIELNNQVKINQRQEVIINKLNQEYQMKHSKR